MVERVEVLFIVGQLGVGGLERQLWYLATEFERRGISTAVAVWHLEADAPYRERLEAAGVRVYGVARKGGWLARLARLRRLAKRLRPRVLHSYSFHTNFPAWWAGIDTGAVRIGSIRNQYAEERAAAGALRAVLCSLFPSLLVANSESAADAAREDRSWSAPASVLFIPNAIDLAQYDPSPRSEGSRFEILGIGRLYEPKRWDIALEVLRRFDREHRGTWRFRLCGTGPLAQALRDKAEALDLDSSIEFLGYCRDVAPLLADCDVVLLTSDVEGTPNVVLESMAAARPVVATAVGDVPRLIGDGREGRLAPAGDVDALLRGLTEIANSREIRERMGKAARYRVESEFSVGALADATLAAYRQLGWEE